MAVSSFASAEIITFNSLPGNGTAIPNGFEQECAVARDGPDSAGGRSSLQPPHSLYKNGGAPTTFSASGSFTFGSASAEGSSPMTVEVVGLLGGKVVDRMMIVLRGPVPIRQIFNWSGIDGVRFVPQTLASSNGKLQFALNQMVINGVYRICTGTGINVAARLGSRIGHYPPSQAAPE